MRVDDESKYTDEDGMEMQRQSSTTRSVSQLQQVKALMKKNLKIHMRTNAFPCCPCCGPGQCCPFVVFSGACVHLCFPIFFVFMVTALPYIIIKASLNEKDQREFLEVEIDPGDLPKQYPDWPKTPEMDISKANENLFGFPPHWHEPFYTEANFSENFWERNPPTGVRPLLDNLWLPGQLKWSNSERVPNQYSCWCKTLGLVGPTETVNKFRTFMEAEHAKWESGLEESKRKISLFRRQFWSYYDPNSHRLDFGGKDEKDEKQSFGGKGRRLDKHRFKLFNALTGEDRKGHGKPDHPWKDLEDLFSPYLSNEKRGRMAEIFHYMSQKLEPEKDGSRSGRRLQKGRRRGGDDDKSDWEEPQFEWMACNVNPGAYKGTIYRQFGSTDDLDDYTKGETYGDYESARTKTSTKDRLCGAIIFENDVTTASVPEYTIRMNVTGLSNMWMGYVADDLTQRHTEGMNHDNWRDKFYFYWNSGYMSLQHLMHLFIAETHSSPNGNTDLLKREPSFTFLPVGERNDWMFGDVVGGILGFPFTMSIQFGPIVASIAFYVARERSTRQRELMRMMGLSDTALTCSWMLMFILMNVIACLGMMILFMIFLFKTSDWFLWYIVMFLFANAITAFGISWAAFVSADKWAALAALGAFLGLSFTLFAVPEYASYGVKFLIGLIPSNGFMNVARVWWQLEQRKVGAKFGTANSTIDNMTVSLGILQLFLDFWVWLGIYWYFDQIIPWHAVGVPRKPWFLCTGSYWQEACGKAPLVGDATGIEDGGNPNTKPEFIEKEDDPHLLGLIQNNRSVVVSNLAKYFTNAAGQKIAAVDGLSFKMYQDECFCLLGHNGAGKTTTMMMLTGCMPQSRGAIQVKGFNIPEQIRIVRQDMGFCPQHNVLWDELTVFEHMELFGSLAGMPLVEIDARADQLLTAVALLDKKFARSSSLSGGMKRKLSAALAFLAEPYMVILDEPSSGMDPFARRGMWDTLKRWRSGHIICLTTHYMDEADALGDRIAIMSNGRLACSGTPNFLKRTFGCGYVIAFAKSTSGTEKDGAIVQAVKNVIGANVEIMSAAGKEILVQVPFASADQFPALFQAIDEQKAVLGIESYGTSVTNLEEVFLKVARHGKKEKTKELGGEAENYDLLDKNVPSQLPMVTEFFNQLCALLLRRIKFGLRDKTSCCCECITPTMCLFLAVQLMSFGMVFTLPKLELTTEHWNVDVTSGPTAPTSVGFMQDFGSLAYKTEIANLWKQNDEFNVYANTDLTWTPPEGTWHCHNQKDCWFDRSSSNANSWKGTIIGGVMQEKSFMDYAYPQPATEASQYGAVFYPSISQWCPLETAPGVTIAANLTGLHSTPILLNAHGGVALSLATKGASVPVSKVKVANHPFDKTQWEKDQMVRVSGILAATMIMMAYGFIPATVAFYIVMEKEKDVKNQLIISGCGQVAYWISNFIYDTIWGIIPCSTAMMIFRIYGMTAFIEEPGHSAACAMFFGFLPAMAGFAYLFSFLFSKAGNALIFSWLFNLMMSFLGTIIVSILLSIKQTKDAAIFIRWLFRFIPTFSLGYGCLTISARQSEAKAKDIGGLAGLGVGGTWCTPKEIQAPGANGTLVTIPNPRFDCSVNPECDEYRDNDECVPMVGDEFLILLLCGFLYIILTFLFDIVFGLPCFKKMCGGGRAFFPQTESQKDEMVLAEEKAVFDIQDPSQQFVFVQDLHKVYPNRTYAVRGISFACAEGQVFGLLGVNGAGKTSTFKILCGQVEQTRGRVLIKGIDVANFAPQARRLIGYCPQFDALLESLTTKEHLLLYGRIKGLMGNVLANTVNQQLTELDLTQYVQSRAGRLSGGNKRKLSVAMATIGEPPMVFLDEPSAGMDPVARRGMWSLIQNIAEKRRKSVVILTTHSMEEAEALCSRIAIQVDGQFRCLGTAQQIKSKYGQGLELNVRLASPNKGELAACATKLGGAAGDLVDVETAKQRINAAYDDQIVPHLMGRHGSPLLETKRPVALGVLAEWVLLQERTSNFENFLMKEMNPETGGIPCAHVLEKTQNVARYQIIPEALRGRFKSLGTLFKLFQDNQAALLIEDFQVCQASLEQIFNKFAATQIAQAAYQSAPPGGVAQATTVTVVVPENDNTNPTVVTAPTSGDAAGENNTVQVKPVQLGRAVDEEV